MKILIIGPSGAGKTYLSIYFKDKGLNAVDADTIEGLSSWFNKEIKVAYPSNASSEFFNNHSFLWEEEFLKKYLENKENIYVFGMSGNAFQLLHLFDKIFYLDLPDNIIDERLQHEHRENPMGQTEFQRKNAIKYATQLKTQAKNLGIQFIDATLSPEEILDLIK